MPRCGSMGHGTKNALADREATLGAQRPITLAQARESADRKQAHQRNHERRPARCRSSTRRQGHAIGRQGPRPVWAKGRLQLLGIGVQDVRRRLRLEAARARPTPDQSRHWSEATRRPERARKAVAVPRRARSATLLSGNLCCPAIPLERRCFYAVAVYCYTRPGEVLAFLGGRSIDLKHVRSGSTAPSTTSSACSTNGPNRRQPALRSRARTAPLLDQMWAERPKPGTLLFPRFTHLAEVLREDLMKAGVKRASLHVRRQGSQPIRFHDLRATGITYMAIRGDSDQDVRERAGHADFETTLLYIRRGHLALSSAAIGRPYAALPACVLGESSSGGGESSQKSSFLDDSIPLSKRNHSELCGAGEGIRNHPRERQTAGSPRKTAAKLPNTSCNFLELSWMMEALARRVANEIPTTWRSRWRSPNTRSAVA